MVGKAKMFKLNRANPQVEKFIDYYWTVVKSEVDRQLDRKEEKVSSVSGPVSVAASASHI